MSSAVKTQNCKTLLTVRVDKESLELVKEYAKQNNTTVSQLVRDFFQHLIAEMDRPPESELEQF